MAVPLLVKKIMKKRVKHFKRPQYDCKAGSIKPGTRDFWRLLLYALVWMVWKGRNTVLFRDAIFDVDNVFQATIQLWFFWIKGSKSDFPYRGHDVVSSPEWFVNWY